MWTLQGGDLASRGGEDVERGSVGRRGRRHRGRHRGWGRRGRTVRRYRSGFTRDASGVWSVQQKLTGSERSEGFGADVLISEDGATLFVGSNAFASGSSTDRGVVYECSLSGGNRSQTDVYAPANYGSTQFVDGPLGSDGSRLIVGAGAANTIGPDNGFVNSVYIYEVD